MGNFNSRWIHCLLLLFSASTLRSATITIINNTDTDVVNPAVIRGTFNGQDSSGTTVAGLNGTAAANGGTLVWSGSTSYMDSQVGGSAHKWLKAAQLPYGESISVENIAATSTLAGTTWTFGAAAPENCESTVTVNNDKLIPITVEWVHFLPGVGGLPDTETLYKQAVIFPGESDFFTLVSIKIDGSCNNNGELRAYTVAYTVTEDLEVEQSDEYTASDLDDQANHETVIVNSDDLPPWTLSATNEVTNGTIDWTGATTTEQILQGGFSAQSHQQNSQDVIANALLTAIKTNTANLNFRTNTFSEIETAALAANGYSNSIIAGADTVTLATGISGSVADMTVTIGGQSINLNPFAVPQIATFSSAIRTFILWLSSVFFAVSLVRELKLYIAIAVLAPQASAASSAPIVSSISALAMAAALVTLIGSAVVVLVTYITTTAGYAAAMASPFGGGTLGNAAVLFDNICPIQHLLGLVVAWFVFQFTASGIAAGAALAARFFVGCLFFALVLHPASAASVDFMNATGTNVLVGSYSLPPGQSKFELPGATYTVVGPSGSSSLVVPSSSLTSLDVLAGDTGAAFLLSSDETDLISGFWTGFTLGTGFWVLGYSRRLLFGVTKGMGQ